MQPTLQHLASLDEDQFLAVYETLSSQGFGPLDGEVARALKFRPQAIRKLPLAQRAKKGRQLLLAARNAEMAYELLGTYLFATKRELVTDFLDATGVEHEDGVVEETHSNLPAAEKIPAAVAELDKKYEPSLVTLYLCISAQTWPEIESFERLWRERSGLTAA